MVLNDKLTGDRKEKSSSTRLRRKLSARALDVLGLQRRKTRPPEWRTRSYFRSALSRGVKGIPDERCFVLQNVVRSLRDVPGDIAECGLRFGKSTAFMLTADEAPGRTYCLFDSFEGLSEPQAEDFVKEYGKAYWGPSDLGVPEDRVRKNLASFDNMLFFKGWIPTRFPEVADRSFAMLHVDVDLYQPTKDALEFFWPRIVAGGVVVCDDYGSRKCPGAKRAFDEFFADGRGRLIELPTAQALVLKPS